MDASSKIQGSIHDVRLTYKYVSRILGTYQWLADFCYLHFDKLFMPDATQTQAPYNLLHSLIFQTH